MHLKRYSFVVLFALCLSVSVSTAQGRRTTIPRVSGSLQLDGSLTDDLWNEAWTFDLIMHTPTNGIDPTEPTRVRVMITDEHLWVGAELADSDPSGIQGPTKRRDDLSLSNDWFGVFIDTFNDKQNALGFYTTPAGLRLDYEIFNDAEGSFPINRDWNTFWDVEVKTSDKGWTVEMRIPISSLRFQTAADGETVMGFSVNRFVARKNEWSTYPQISNEWGFWSLFKPSQYMEVGIRDLKQQRPLYIAPYVVTGATQNHLLNPSETAYRAENTTELEAGLDVKVGLTNNLTADFTINTDFAQVEADDQQVNLTRFSLFFPEKRLFFLERSSTFDFSFGEDDRLFYSRRIGIDDGDLTRIYAGARVVGREGPWDIGILTMQTEAPSGQGSPNNSVVRLKRQVVNRYSYLGGMATSRIDTRGSTDVAYGLDGLLNFGDQHFLSTAIAQSVNESSGIRSRVNLQKRGYGGLTYDADLSYAGKSYDPGLGFQSRVDFSRVATSLNYGWIPKGHRTINRHRVSVSGIALRQNSDQVIESASGSLLYDLETRSAWAFSSQWLTSHENVPDQFSLGRDVVVPSGEHTFTGLTTSLETSTSALAGASVSGYVGSFYDGQRQSISISPRWSVSPSLTLSGLVRYEHITFPSRNQSLDATIFRFRTLYMLNTKFSVAAFAQYSNQSDIIQSNLRLRYNATEGNDLYIVYNNVANTDRERELPTLPPIRTQTLLIKYTYTFAR